MVALKAIGARLFVPVLAIVAFIVIGAVASLSGLRSIWKILAGLGLIGGSLMLFKGVLRTLFFVFGAAFLVMGIVEYTGVIQPTGSLHIGGRKRATRKGAGF